MIFILGILGLFYMLAMGTLVYGFTRLKTFSSNKDNEAGFEGNTSVTLFSIVIPFRNEEKNLPTLLNSLQQLAYPTSHFEVILVDDASEDKSEELIKKFVEKNPSLNNFRIIKNIRTTASPKKDAIKTAINLAHNDWILTTDADCSFNAQWLNIYDNYIQLHNPSMIAGPVFYSANEKLISQFQLFDGLSLQAVTMSSFGLNVPILCNGANLAYKKDAFETVSGFSDNDHIASGDDIFMLEKMLQLDKTKVHFLKSEHAIVRTQPQLTWFEVINQRIRWASKTKHQRNGISQSLGMLVFLTNLFIILGALIAIYDSKFLPYFIAFFLMKFIIDLSIILMTSKFFKVRIKRIYFMLSMLCYPYIIVGVVLGSLMGTYMWKGRKFGNLP
jgi:biofilm PGA synthesis N-glycosyltransferase PgaC